MLALFKLIEYIYSEGPIPPTLLSHKSDLVLAWLQLVHMFNPYL